VRTDVTGQGCFLGRMIFRRTIGLALVLAASGLWAAGAASAQTRVYWIAATPVTWNIVPNGHDAIGGATFSPADTVFPTVVYRRFTTNWRRPLPNVPDSSSNQDLIPGPLIRARVGDHIVVHFKNMDMLYGRPHSMHFHGVHYAPSSDGAYIPGFSGPGGNVPAGHSFTYRLFAGSDSWGVWPYHDHSQSMEASIAGGMFGMLSILRPHERAPDREFEVVFAPWGPFQTIDDRAYVGNTPVFTAFVGQIVQWDVMAMGSDHHVFHVHGHRWIGADGVPRDSQTVGPAESFAIRWREQDPGTWLYHCHVEAHMMAGMIGIYQVRRR
jgi:FtsP/CotA-like multicopper oxidase with cupredoxin domain